MAEINLITGSFPDDSGRAPLSDLTIVGMRHVPDFDVMTRVMTLTRASCLFVSDSGLESARA